MSRNDRFYKGFHHFRATFPGPGQAVRPRREQEKINEQEKEIDLSIELGWGRGCSGWLEKLIN